MPLKDCNNPKTVIPDLLIAVLFEGYSQRNLAVKLKVDNMSKQVVLPALKQSIFIKS